MKDVKMEKFHIVGITVRTTNENGKAAADIPTLWDRFMKEKIVEKIPNKISADVYSMYTDYESDHTKPYTTLLGCRVSSLDNVPEGMEGKTIEASNYTKFNTQGDLTKNIVYDEWLKIWNMDLKRTYQSDFEIYGEKASNPTDAEVDIFIAVE